MLEHLKKITTVMQIWRIWSLVESSLCITELPFCPQKKNKTHCCNQSHIPQHQMCINPRMKIVPTKQSCLKKPLSKLQCHQNESVFQVAVGATYRRWTNTLSVLLVLCSQRLTTRFEGWSAVSMKRHTDPLSNWRMFWPPLASPHTIHP